MNRVCYNVQKNIRTLAAAVLLEPQYLSLRPSQLHEPAASGAQPQSPQHSPPHHHSQPPIPSQPPRTRLQAEQEHLATKQVESKPEAERFAIDRGLEFEKQAGANKAQIERVAEEADFQGLQGTELCSRRLQDPLPMRVIIQLQQPPSLKSKSPVHAKYEPLIVSQIKTILESEGSSHQKAWIAARKQEIPKNQNQERGMTIHNLLSYWRGIPKSKRDFLLVKLQQSILEFVSFTRCLVCQYSETVFWRYLYLWSFKCSYPRSKREPALILIPSDLDDAFAKLLVLSQAASLSFKRKLYQDRHSTLNQLHQNISSLSKKFKTKFQGRELAKTNYISEQEFEKAENELGVFSLLGKKERLENSLQNRLTQHFTKIYK